MKMRVFIDRVVMDGDPRNAPSEASIAEGVRSSLRARFLGNSLTFVNGSDHRVLTVNVPAGARPAAIGASLGSCVGHSLGSAIDTGRSAK